MASVGAARGKGPSVKREGSSAAGSASPSAGAGECCCVANGAGAASASCCGTGGAQAAGALCADKVPVKEIDARALQCPGPIMRLREELDAVEAGSAVAVLAADPAFPRDIRAWCHSTGHTLLDVAPVNGHVRATIRKNARPAVAAAPSGAINSKSKSILVFSGDLDKALAAFVIANGAAAMGSDVTMFFTFWGLNVLRRPEKVRTSKNLIERMFGWIMPRGAGRLRLSQMHMAGMGAAMIRGIMRRKNVPPLPELIASARRAGVRLVACSMSMDLMGIRREELIDGVEEGGVATYLDRAEAGCVNLFI